MSFAYGLRGNFSIYWPPSPRRTKEEMFLNLGPDWFLLFVQGHVHPSTVVLGLKLLLHFLSNPSLRGRFKDGLSAGSWVERSSEGVDIMMGECVVISRRQGASCGLWVRTCQDLLGAFTALCCRITLTLTPSLPSAPAPSDFLFRIPPWPHCSSDAGGFFPFLKASLALSLFLGCFPHPQYQHGSPVWWGFILQFLIQMLLPLGKSRMD